jgi:hypothetical protein
LQELPERPSWWETAKGYQKALIIVGSMFGFISLAACAIGGWRSYSYKTRPVQKNHEETNNTDEKDFKVSETNNINGAEGDNEVEITM